MTTAFVVNSGSSSIKWTLVDVGSGQSRGGIVERVTDHAEAMRGILEELGGEHPAVIGHRVVHGGSVFTAATLVTEEVERAIDELSALAPLHNPANLAGIRAARAAFPGVPNVAVFDTAFHQTASGGTDSTAPRTSTSPAPRASCSAGTTPSSSCSTSAAEHPCAPSTRASRSRPRWG